MNEVQNTDRHLSKSRIFSAPAAILKNGKGF